MNAKQFRIVSVAVAVRAEDADDVAEQLSDISGNYGFYSMGTSEKVPSRAEWKEIRDNAPEDIINADEIAEEQQRRDEKNGLYGPDKGQAI